MLLGLLSGGLGHYVIGPTLWWARPLCYWAYSLVIMLLGLLSGGLGHYVIGPTLWWARPLCYWAYSLVG